MHWTAISWRTISLGVRRAGKTPEDGVNVDNVVVVVNVFLVVLEMLSSACFELGEIEVVGWPFKLSIGGLCRCLVVSVLFALDVVVDGGGGGVILSWGEGLDIKDDIMWILLLEEGAVSLEVEKVEMLGLEEALLKLEDEETMVLLLLLLVLAIVPDVAEVSVVPDASETFLLLLFLARSWEDWQAFKGYLERTAGSEQVLFAVGVRGVSWWS